MDCLPFFTEKDLTRHASMVAEAEIVSHMSHVQLIIVFTRTAIYFPNHGIPCHDLLVFLFESLVQGS
jgi:hypothetical protein